MKSPVDILKGKLRHIVTMTDFKNIIEAMDEYANQEVGKIQQIIKELKVEQSNSRHAAESYEIENKELFQYYCGSQRAFELCISKLKSMQQSDGSGEVDRGTCIENNCKRKAVKDYNGHGHWVCEDHYDSLNREFDREYN